MIKTLSTKANTCKVLIQYKNEVNLFNVPKNNSENNDKNEVVLAKQTFFWFF